MLASQIPARIPLPFANGGTKNTIPTASQIGITPGAASLTDGFPPLTFTPLAAGGVPPAGADFNGILNAITAVQQWQSAGGSFTFNTAFSTSIGGYPKGATLMSTSGDTNWLSTADNNTTDPDSVAAANWVALDACGIGAVMGLTNANVTLTPAQYGKPIITLAGTLTGNVQMIFPVNQPLCTVINNTIGAFTVTCKTASGTGSSVMQGSFQVIYGNGTNIAPVGYATQVGLQQNGYCIATAGGTSDAITGTYTPTISLLTNGMTLYFRAAYANATTTPTFKADGMAIKTVVKGNNLPLAVGDIAGAGHWIELQYDVPLDKWVLLNPATGLTGVGLSSHFSKADSQSVVFTKTGSGTLNLKAGTYIDMAVTLLTFAVATAVVMPTFAAGTDYAIYACADGTVRADANFTNPVGYTTANSRLIGGFHYGLVAAGTTVAGGSFNTGGAVTTGGMVWVQSNVDDIAGINKFSLWDLKFRPLCDPRGMVLTNSSTWVDIYLCSTDPAANGTSKYNSNIASGTVLAKIPLAFGGNGTITYGAGDWWSFNEIARAYGKRFMLASEFYDAAFGVTENQSVDATVSTYPNTQRNAGFTSKYGIEQAAGVHYTWGQDSAGAASGAWVANGGRGQSINGNTVRVLLGGSRAVGANSGSRCSGWNSATSSSVWSIGLRAACDHLQLV
jgi:hypothetical protein